MSSTTRPHQYVLTIRSIGPVSTVMARLRGVLKSLRRAWGFHLVDIRPADGGQGGPAGQGAAECGSGSLPAGEGSQGFSFSIKSAAVATSQPAGEEESRCK